MRHIWRDVLLSLTLLLHSQIRCPESLLSALPAVGDVTTFVLNSLPKLICRIEPRVRGLYCYRALTSMCPMPVLPFACASTLSCLVSNVKRGHQYHVVIKLGAIVLVFLTTTNEARLEVWADLIWADLMHRMKG